jgi:hypothetical protein
VRSTARKISLNVFMLSVYSCCFKGPTNGNKQIFYQHQFCYKMFDVYECLEITWRSRSTGRESLVLAMKSMIDNLISFLAEKWNLKWTESETEYKYLNNLCPIAGAVSYYSTLMFHVFFKRLQPKAYISLVFNKTCIHWMI